MEGAMPPDLAFRRRRLWVLGLTFLAYTCFHASRKPAGVVKAALHPVSDGGASLYDPVANPGWRPFADDLIPSVVGPAGYAVTGAGVRDVNGGFECVKVVAGVACEDYWHGAFSLTTVEDPAVLQRLGLGNRSGAWIIRALPGASAWCPAATEGDPAAIARCVLYVQLAPTASVVPPIPAPCGSHADPQRNTNWQATAALVGAAPRVTPRVPDGLTLMGYCDTAYLLAYALAMFVTGVLADHMSLRWFLLIAVTGSSVFLALVGMAYYWNIHSLSYFLAMYAVQGGFQSMGWPAVAAIAGPWVAKGTRGVVLGVWNCSTFVGNILGAALASAALGVGGGPHANWAMPFLLCAALLLVSGVAVAVTVPVRPPTGPLPLADDDGLWEEEGEAPGEEEPEAEGVAAAWRGFLRALAVPGVLEYSLSLFFIKLVCYALVYWLPYYLGTLGFSPQDAGYLSAFVDVGGIVGGVGIGVIADRWDRPALASLLFMLACGPALWAYRTLPLLTHSAAPWAHALAMVLVGALPNGPYTLITNAVAVDLGQSGRGRDLATVIAIIDATGSLGAAVQGVAVAAVTTALGWDAVFDFFIVCCVLSAVLLTRLVWRECGRAGAG